MDKDRLKAASEGARDFIASPSKFIAGPLQTRECASFADHYATLQHDTGQIVPPRKGFNPAHIRSFLPYISILELKEPKVALVRLVGTAIVNRTHMDNTGRNMMDVLPPKSRDWSWDHFKRIANTPCGATFLAREDYKHASLWVEIISFPLADDDGVARYIISLSIEVDRQQLALRGNQAMEITELSGYRYIDIGGGV